MTRPSDAESQDTPTGRQGQVPSVSVVIPALNEERNLPYVFGRLPIDISEVILVDGGSTDRTVDLARELYPDVIVVQQTRRGKGNALACGFAACTSDIIVMIDADGSTDPAEIPRFVQALVAGADYAKGSRFRPGGDSHDITRFRKLGNYGLNGVVNVLFKTHFTDLCYGYNAFWNRALTCMDLPSTALAPRADGNKRWGDGFEIETLINIRVAAAGMRIAEVPSVEARRLHGVSNLNAFSDGSRVLRTIMVEFRRLRGSKLRRTAPAVEGRTEHVEMRYIPTQPIRVHRPSVVSSRPIRTTTRPEPAGFVAREER
jgi:glycosyltransferase involved in cell wall biosynthesis